MWILWGAAKAGIAMEIKRIGINKSPARSFIATAPEDQFEIGRTAGAVSGVTEDLETSFCTIQARPVHLSTAGHLTGCTV
jgi:hypothetical protein